jgi:undecaprenyl-diphosphatase
MNNLTIMKAAILGALQGATEFLPVSSSGHLVIVQSLLGIRLEGGGLLAFDVCLHFGTLVAVLIVFWRDIVAILASFFGRKFSADIGPVTVKQYRKLGYFIILGTIPAVIIGLSFEHFFEKLVSNPTPAAFMLLVTGTILWCTRFTSERSGGLAGLSWPKAILVGIAQAFAIIPGISRSGTTISTALYLGVDRATAARFSFLLAVPVIGGATILKLDELSLLSNDVLIATAIGTIVSAIVGFVCIKWLLAIIRRGHLSWFAYYCWAAGIATIVYSVFLS